MTKYADEIDKKIFNEGEDEMKALAKNGVKVFQGDIVPMVYK